MYVNSMSSLKKTPYDELFKSRENACDILSAVLPQNIIARMYMESVYVEDFSYLDENLAKHFSNINRLYFQKAKVF